MPSRIGLWSASFDGPRLASSGPLLFGVALLQHGGKLSAELLHLVLDRTGQRNLTPQSDK